MRVLITGGAGFIGSNLAHALVARGDEVQVLDNFSTGRRENLDGLDIPIYVGDVQDKELIRSAMSYVDCVLHQAALPSVSRSVENPWASFEANVVGSMTVFETARELGVKRIVYAASSSAYGETEVLPKVETMPANPVSPYGAFKAFGEDLCRVWSKVFGLECVALRYFNVFGPRQRPDSEYAAVIPKFIRLMSNGERPVIYGDGTQSRDFCFINNVVEANLKAMEAPAAPGNVYNVACGERTSLLDLVDKLNGILGTSLEPVLNPSRTGDIKHSLADITQAQQDLGYSAAVKFDEGLRRTVEWYRK